MLGISTYSTKNKEVLLRIRTVPFENCCGASEASGATFTDHVAGAREMYAPACMYVSYMHQALGPITPRACTNGAESAIFEIFFTGKGNSGKKRSLALEWARTWV